MLAILPILFFLCTFLAVHRRSALGLREAFLTSAVIWGITLAALTEVLSLLHQLTAEALTGCWLALVLPPATMALRRVFPRPEPAEKEAPFLGPGRSLPEFLNRILAVLIGLIVAATGVLALRAAPNNADSMTYHLARVAHWIQNRDVAFYPTAFHPQLHNPPCAEYALLHFMLLGRNDRLVNLVQWFSMAGSVLGVSLIARQLGAGRTGQIAAALFCVTLPMGILQATSTQNDYVTAFWLVCLTHFILRVRSGPTVGNVLATGTCLGLALLTKGTAFVFAGPLLLGLLPIFNRRAFRLAALRIVSVLLIAGALNASHFLRNYQMYGKVAVDREGDIPGLCEYRNAVYSPGVLTSNLCRNLALHLESPWRFGNRAADRAVRLFHKCQGLDVNDPRTTFLSMRFAVPPLGVPLKHEDVSGNLPHLLLLIALLGGIGVPRMIGLVRGQAPAGETFYLSGAVLLAFIFFCLTIRWQPFHSRLHLPLFVLIAPVAGTALARRASAGLAIIAIALVGWSIPYLLWNSTRPLIGDGNVWQVRRPDQYFHGIPAWGADYQGAAAYLRDCGCRRVGLVFNPSDYEYPLWRFLTDFDPRKCRLEHLAFDSLAARAVNDRHRAFRPDALVVTRHGPSAAEVSSQGRTYWRSWSSPILDVYLPSH